ncbi:MAG: dGTPase [Frankiales bacterium]|jgi:dGTPase|nr:dGTPase [Frankiales bacterium]
MTREAERRVAEPAKATDTYRSPYQRDRARVLHSAALRRLAAKTQVVGVGEDDFPRTRLTHSLECAQVGRELAGALGADPDLVDAACLAHDLGHPPYGHNGETALALAAEPCGGFEGNAQSLRILTRLEAKVLDADGRSAGLNLTRAVLDAATKYPWPRREGTTKFGAYADELSVFAWLREDSPGDRRCVEAQVMDWADDVAYSVHDLEDGIHSGQVPLHKIDVDAVVHLAALTGCASAPDLDELYQELSAQPWWVHEYDGTLRAQAAVKRMTSELTARLTAAVVRATRAEYGDGPLIRYEADVVVPERTRAECELLKAIAVHYVMLGRRAVQEQQRQLLTELVDLLAARPDQLEPALAEVWHQGGDDLQRLRVVIDQVASLTDPSAAAWHARLRSGRSGPASPR